MIEKAAAIEAVQTAIRLSGVKFTTYSGNAATCGNGWDVAIITNNQSGRMLVRPIGTPQGILEERLGKPANWLEVNGLLVSPVPKDNQTGRRAERFLKTLSQIGS